MKTRHVRLALALLVGMTALVSVTDLVQPASASAGFTFRRIAGENRYETSTLLAAEQGHADAVVLVSTGADAVVASGLAGTERAPIVLVAPDALPPASLRAIKSSGATRAIIVGGSAVVSQRVAAAVKDLGLAIERVAGDTRYTTSQLVAARIGSAGGVEGVRTVVVASGVGLADAVAVGPIAFARRLPVLLTPPTSLAPGLAGSIAAAGAGRLLLVGGTAAVGQAVQSSLSVDGVAVERVAGLNRSATSVALARWSIAHAGAASDHVHIARGDDLADAIAVAPHAGRAEAPSPLVLVSAPAAPGADALDFMRTQATELGAGVIVGGLRAVTSTAEVALVEALLGARSAPSGPSTTTTTAAEGGGGGTGGGGIPTGGVPPLPTLPPGPAPSLTAPSSQALIAKALQNKQIDYPMSLRLRALALFADLSLPLPLVGSGSVPEDGSLPDEIERIQPTLSPAHAAELGRFFLRPNDPGSYFSRPAAAATLASAELTRSPKLELIKACARWTSAKAAVLNIRIWTCDGPNAITTLKAADAVISAQLPAVTALLGDARPDDGSVSKAINPDPLVDVYVVRKNSYQTRGFDLPSAFGAQAVPLGGVFSGRQSSGFMIVDEAAVGAPLLKVALVHEFTHIIEFGHLDRAFGLRCNNITWVYEATARWADIEFAKPAKDRLEAEMVTGQWNVPGHPPVQEQPGFQKRGVSSLYDGNPYNAFIWFRYVAQQLGPQKVRAIWDSIEGVGQCLEVTKAIDKVVPFKDHFKKFALRNLNMKVGTAIPKPYSDDPEFPVDKPPVFELEDALKKEQAAPLPLALPPLSAAYYKITSVDAQTRWVAFDFSQLDDVEGVEVQVVYKANGTWFHKEGKDHKVGLCRTRADAPSEEATELYVVVSNNSLESTAKGTGTLVARADACAGRVEGTVTETITSGFDAPYVWTATIKMESHEPDPKKPLEYTTWRDAGSTWTLKGRKTEPKACEAGSSTLTFSGKGTMGAGGIHFELLPTDYKKAMIAIASVVGTVTPSGPCGGVPGAVPVSPPLCPLPLPKPRNASTIPGIDGPANEVGSDLQVKRSCSLAVYDNAVDLKVIPEPR